MNKKAAPPDTSYLYVVVRDDLPQPHKTVQACHAAFAARHSFNFHTPNPYMVICTAPNEDALNDLFNRLKETGVPVCGNYEPDFAGNPLTSIATGPLKGNERQPLRRLPMLTSG